MASVEKITAPKVQQALQEHLQRHELKLDGKLHDVYHAVFGEQGKGGICDEFEKVKGNMEHINDRLAKIEGGINKVLWIVITAVLAAVLKLVFIP